ncbi:MAG TPA: FAD/NAD(P)-binding oxidoreductase [Thermoanaerobaculia bacterium]|nr:FAD/NAD(P)-binding oxidoreductase [Thermoanaerobaculia bacterium]
MREQHASSLETQVLVVGAGPAGLAAAAAACDSGVEVLVVDEGPAAGGQIWRQGRGAPRPETRALLERARGARLLTGLAVFDAEPPAGDGIRLRALDATQRVVELRAERVVLALGATERFLPFPGWTLPGVFGVGGLQAMVEGGMEVAGRRVLIAGSGPLLLAVAVSMRAAGARVLGVFEQAPRGAVTRFGLGLARHPRKLRQALGLLARLARVPRRYSSWPLRAEGDEALRSVTLRVGATQRTLDAELLACAFGLAPATGLAALLGCAVDEGRVAVDELQRTTVDRVLCAGESTGIGGVELALAEGEVAGRAAAGDLDRARAAIFRASRERRFAAALERAFTLRPELRDLPRDDTVVCRCEDVPWGAVRVWRDPRQAKLETRCGMGPCQGRVCGAALEVLRGWPRETPRPPLIPVPFHALADRPRSSDAADLPVGRVLDPIVRGPIVRGRNVGARPSRGSAASEEGGSLDPSRCSKADRAASSAVATTRADRRHP